MTMGDAHRSEGHQCALVVELANNLCEPEDARLIAEHTRSCPACARERAERREVDELLLALGDVEQPPGAPAPHLPPGSARRRPAPRTPAFAAPFAAAAGMLESVLAEVGEEVLDQPGPVLSWRLGDLIPHLAAGNALLATVIGVSVEPAPRVGADLVSHTERLLDWVTGWPHGSVQSLWRHGVESIAAWLRARPELADRLVEVGGVQLTVANQLTVRAFETWIHARDIGVAAGLRVPPPPADSLARMADLAVRLLSTLPPRAATAPAGTVRLTLTGPGGGSWLVAVGGAIESERPDAELTLDTVEFCLLVGDRRNPARMAAEIVGEDALADELFAITPQLSGP